MAKIEGEIWFNDDGVVRLAIDQFNLLQAIRETGSISSAAREIGISYKTAWDRIEQLNNLSPNSLVSRAAGGKKGGGTRLTGYGIEILEGVMKLNQKHQEFIASLNQEMGSIDDLRSFMKYSNLKSTARNQYLGRVSSVLIGELNTEVLLDIGPNLKLVAQITDQSRENLCLTDGSVVFAMVKASSVTLSTGKVLHVSARNQLSGLISRINRGPINADISIDLGDAKTLSAAITSYSLVSMGLSEGMRVNAFFKASSIILLQA